MAYTAVELQRPIRIERIITVHYFEYGPDYAFAGESHDFWEIVYVDKGEIIAQAGETEHLLQKGQMLFHEPGEFHTLKAAGGRAPNVVVITFECDGPAMDFFRGRLLSAGDAERNLMARIVEQAAEAFATPLDDPLSQMMGGGRSSLSVRRN